MTPHDLETAILLALSEAGGSATAAEVSRWVRANAPLSPQEGEGLQERVGSLMAQLVGQGRLAQEGPSFSLTRAGLEALSLSMGD